MMDDSGAKWLTAERLAELLAQLPKDSWVCVNRVGNLSVYSPDGSENVGYVDFSGDGETVVFGDDDENS